MSRKLDEHGGRLESIISRLGTQLVHESHAHVVLTTAHKSKGREWDNVALDDDFGKVVDSRGRIKVEE